MRRFRALTVSAVVIAPLFLLGISLTMTLDSDFGKLEVKTISITDDNKELSGLLYRPDSASAENPSAAVVIAHGIGGSKEMMSSLGLELGRRGFVALCLDLFGHGKSGGTVEDGRNEPSFGVLTAVQYLESQRFVNSSAIGLVGHSLGGGAMRAAVAHDSQIDALVLIAGGLGDIAEGQEYGVLNSTFPKNLLVVVGKYDVLFNLTELASEKLPPVFATQQGVVPGVLYGSFKSRARALKNLPRLFETKIRLREALAGAFGRKELSIAVVTFLVLFAVANLLEAMLNINLRIVSPIFRGFSSGRRIFAFLTFVPFFLHISWQRACIFMSSITAKSKEA